MGAPVRFQKAVPRTKEKRRGGAPRGERADRKAERAADYLVKPLNMKQLHGILSRVTKPSTLASIRPRL